ILVLELFELQEFVLNKRLMTTQVFGFDCPRKESKQRLPKLTALYTGVLLFGKRTHGSDLKERSTNDSKNKREEEEVLKTLLLRSLNQPLGRG
ncbi:unnamed protein product, partial [Prunus brigantina]